MSGVFFLYNNGFLYSQASLSFIQQTITTLTALHRQRELRERCLQCPGRSRRSQSLLLRSLTNTQILPAFLPAPRRSSGILCNPQQVMCFVLACARVSVGIRRCSGDNHVAILLLCADKTNHLYLACRRFHSELSPGVHAISDASVVYLLLSKVYLSSVS